MSDSGGLAGLVLTGGGGPPRRRIEPYLAEVSIVVAADSGLDLARQVGIEPDLIVGDMDSLTDPHGLSVYPADRVVRFPRDKDETDTEIGVRVLVERGIERIILAGGGGGRMAHLIGILALFLRPHAPGVWLTDREHVEAICDRIRVSGCLGETFSFFPLVEARVGTSSGLKWPLDGLVWRPGDVGISNVAEADSISVELEMGRLLMVREFGD